MLLEWTHKENGKESFIQTDVNIKKSVNSNYGYGGSLICNKCKGKLSQKYVCDCGEEYTIGEVENRKDKISGIIYNDNQKKQFMEYKVDIDIKVIDEIPLSDVLENIEFIGKFYEIYNNEKQSELIKKIHNFLHKKQIVLVVEYGYLGKEQTGFIFSTQNKLLLIQLRDGQLIKEPKQLELNNRANGYTEKLMALTESREPQLYKEFLMKIQNGEKIEKPKEKKTEKPMKVEVDFLKGF